jgi:hypothetical protein
MNILYRTNKAIILSLCVFNALAAMNEECKSLTEFTCFSQLEPELKLIILHNTDNTQLQRVNKYCAQVWSISSPGIFTDEFCRNNTDRVTHILLKAAYFQNCAGVENILKNSTYLSYVKDKTPYQSIYIDRGTSERVKTRVLDRSAVTQYHTSNTIKILFDKYNIEEYKKEIAGLGFCGAEKSIESNVDTTLSPLEMACFYNCPDKIFIHPVLNIIIDALSIAIDYDHAECVKAIYDRYSAPRYQHTIESLFTKEILKKACYGKQLSSLEVLLQTLCFDLNKVNIRKKSITISKPTGSFPAVEYDCDKTLLDRIIEMSKTDDEYVKVVILLRDYGAKTREECIWEERQKDEQAAANENCIIS